jgi:hypothetical protein
MLVRRSLNVFGLDLVWDGRMVKAVEQKKGKENVIEVRSARTMTDAGREMAALEDEFHRIAGAMG